VSDVNANIGVNIDSSQALAQLKALQRQISDFNLSIAKSNEAAALAQKSLQRNLINSINSIGSFSAELRTVNTTAESFTKALETNKLSMREYFRYAAASTKTFGNSFKSELDTIGKVAEERVKTLQTQYIKLGRDANGAMKAIAVRPLALDMDSLATKTQIAAQKQAIFNQVLKQGSTQLLNFGKNTQWAGRQLMVGFTLPLAAFGATASKAFKDLETEVIKFKKVYGDLGTDKAQTDQALKNIKALADGYTKYGVEVSKTVGLASQAAAAGFQGADLMAQTEAATKLAILGQIEQQQALETTISLQNAFKISSTELASTIDFLNAVENQTVTSLDDITTAIPKVAPVIQSLGGDVKDLAFFLTAMKEGGVNASEGANALKSGLASLINPSKKANEMLAGMGININNIVNKNQGNLKATVVEFARELDKLDPLSRARAIETMFGKFQFARISTLMSNVTKSGTQAARVLDLAGESASNLANLTSKELGITAESALVRFQASMAKLRASLAPVGEVFMKSFAPILDFLSGILDKFNNLGDGTKKFIAITVGVVGGLGPILLMTFGLLANGIANIIKLFATLRNGYLRLTGQSQNLGEQTQYLTNEQLSAAAAAHSLEQSHARLTQQFTAEATEVNLLRIAYQEALTAGAKFAMLNPGMMKAPKLPKFAGGTEGVVVRGPGTGTSDSIIARVSNGEAIIPAASVARNPDLVRALVAGNIPGFAFGDEGIAFNGRTYDIPVGTKASAGIQKILERFSNDVEGTSLVLENLEANAKNAGEAFGKINTKTFDNLMKSSGVEKNAKEKYRSVDVPGSWDASHFGQKYTKTGQELLDMVEGRTDAKAENIRKMVENKLDQEFTAFDNMVVAQETKLNREFDKQNTKANRELGKAGIGVERVRALSTGKGYAEVRDIELQRQLTQVERTMPDGTKRPLMSMEKFVKINEQLTEEINRRFDDLGKGATLTSEEYNALMQEAYSAIAETNSDVAVALNDMKQVNTVYNPGAGANRGARQAITDQSYTEYRTGTFDQENKYPGMMAQRIDKESIPFPEVGRYGITTRAAQQMGYSLNAVWDSYQLLSDEAKVRLSKLKGDTLKWTAAFQEEAQLAGIKIGEAATTGVAKGARTASNSKATRETGKFIDGGLAEGMIANEAVVVAAGTRVGEVAVASVNASATAALKKPRRVSASTQGSPETARLYNPAAAAPEGAIMLPIIAKLTQEELLADKLAKEKIAKRQALKQKLTPKFGLDAGGMKTSMGLMVGSMALSTLPEFTGKALMQSTANMAAMGAMFGPWGAAAGAAVGLVTAGLTHLIEKEKEQKAMQEAVFKPSADLATYFGNAVVDTDASLSHFNVTLTGSKNKSDELKESFGFTNQELKLFMDLINSLPENNALKEMIVGLTDENNPEIIVKIAKAFVTTQVAMGQIKPDQAQKTLDLMLSASGHAGLIGSAFMGLNTQVSAISKTLKAAAGNTDRLGDTLASLIAAASNSTSLEQMNQIILGIARSGLNGAAALDALRQAYIRLNNPTAAKEVALLSRVEGMNANNVAYVQSALDAGLELDLNVQKGITKNKKWIMQQAKDFLDKNGTYGMQQAKTSKDPQVEALNKQNASLEDRIKLLEKQKKLIDDRIKKEEKISAEIKRQNDYIQSQQDIEKKIIEAKLRGNYIEAALLGQQKLANTAQYNYDTKISGLKDQSDAYAKAIEELKDKTGDNSAAISTLTDSVDVLNKTIKTWKPGGIKAPGDYANPLPLGTVKDAMKAIGLKDSMYATIKSNDWNELYQISGIREAIKKFAIENAIPKDVQFTLTNADGSKTQFKVVDDKGNVQLQRVIPVKKAMGGIIRHYGDGTGNGTVTGPGTSTSDSIPAMLSDGEYVVKASAVDKYGVPLLHAINSEKLAKGGGLGRNRLSSSHMSSSKINKEFVTQTQIDEMLAEQGMDPSKFRDKSRNLPSKITPGLIAKIMAERTKPGSLASYQQMAIRAMKGSGRNQDFMVDHLNDATAMNMPNWNLPGSYAHLARIMAESGRSKEFIREKLGLPSSTYVPGKWAAGGLIQHFGGGGMPSAPHNKGMQWGGQGDLNSYQKFMLSIARDSGFVDKFFGVDSVFRTLAGKPKGKSDMVYAGLAPLEGLSKVPATALKASKAMNFGSKIAAPFNFIKKVATFPATRKAEAAAEQARIAAEAEEQARITREAMEFAKNNPKPVRPGSGAPTPSASLWDDVDWGDTSAYDVPAKAPSLFSKISNSPFGKASKFIAKPITAPIYFAKDIASMAGQSWKYGYNDKIKWNGELGNRWDRNTLYREFLTKTIGKLGDVYNPKTTALSRVKAMDAKNEALGLPQQRGIDALTLLQKYMMPTAKSGKSWLNLAYSNIPKNLGNQFIVDPLKTAGNATKKFGMEMWNRLGSYKQGKNVALTDFITKKLRGQEVSAYESALFKDAAISRFMPNRISSIISMMRSVHRSTVPWTDLKGAAYREWDAVMNGKEIPVNAYGPGNYLARAKEISDQSFEGFGNFQYRPTLTLSAMMKLLTKRGYITDDIYTRLRKLPWNKDLPETMYGAMETAKFHMTDPTVQKLLKMGFIGYKHREAATNWLLGEMPGMGMQLIKHPENYDMSNVLTHVTNRIGLKDIPGNFNLESLRELLLQGRQKFHDWNGVVPGPYGQELDAVLKSGTEGVYQNDYIAGLKREAAGNSSTSNANTVYNNNIVINGTDLNKKELADELMSRLDRVQKSNNKSNKVVF
jgi:TP901 family phage tail tape measure protein